MHAHMRAFKLHEAAMRTVVSNFRCHLYEAFSGRPWVVWLACVGDLPKSLCDIAAARWEQMVLKGSGKQPSEGPHPAPKLSAGRRAAHAGQKAELTKNQGHIKGRMQKGDEPKNR